MTAVELLDKLSDFAERVHGMLWADGWHDLDEIADRLEEELSELDSVRCRLPEEHEELADGGCYDDEDYAAAMWVREHGGIAAVERRLLPDGMEWPRFENDAPVAFRDKGLDVHGAVRSVEGVKFTQGGFAFISDGAGDTWWANDMGATECAEIDPKKRVKRPAPKVFDADGVEIRVGDTVCGTRDMEPMRVVDTDSRECGFKRIKCEKEGEGFFFYCADELTHKLTILAADGKPLREGETVWDVESGIEYEVVGIHTDEDSPVRVMRTDGSHLAKAAKPSTLTHQRPDSWERLEEDASKEACEYFAHMPCGCETSEMLDETVEKCNAAKARDLVRRCKALAERGA